MIEVAKTADEVAYEVKKQELSKMCDELQKILDHYMRGVPTHVCYQIAEDLHFVGFRVVSSLSQENQTEAAQYVQVDSLNHT